MVSEDMAIGRSCYMFLIPKYDGVLIVTVSKLLIRSSRYTNNATRGKKVDLKPS